MKIGTPSSVLPSQTRASTSFNLVIRSVLVSVMFALITRIGVHLSQDCSKFDRELKETHAPCSAEVAREIPMRMIL